VRIVQASLLGSILSNLLLVLGFCFLLGGCKFETQRFNVDSAQTAASMLALAVTGVMIPACFDLTAGTNHDSAGLALSRGTSVILLVMYLLYLIFQLKTHAHLYSGDGEGGGGSLEEIAQMSVSASIVTLIVVTMIVSVCAEFLVDSIKVVSEGTGWSETFIGLIIVPIVGNAAEHMTAVTVAMKDKMDLALAVAIGSSMQVSIFNNYLFALTSL
jgi:Ca2+:H+ antiporter